MGFSQLGRKIKRNIEDYGVKTAILKSTAYLLRPIFRYQVYRMYRIDIENIIPQALSLHRLSYKLVCSEDTKVIEEIEKEVEWLRSKAREKILKGDLCMVALFQDKMVGFNLVTFGEVYIPLIDIVRVFRQNEAWSEHIAVHKKFRKMGLGTEIRHRIIEELKKRGIKRLYGGTIISNKQSLQLARKVGFREMVDVTYVKALKFKRWQCKRVQK